jgi:scyllo-inositol 2-dehydrogenase (NAD+)
VYGYDVRTEVIGSKGSILVGTLRQTPATFLKSNGGTYELTDGFLTRFADAYLAEVRDFVDNMLNERNPRVTGEDGLRAVQIAVAAQKSSLTGISCPVDQSA